MKAIFIKISGIIYLTPYYSVVSVKNFKSFTEYAEFKEFLELLIIKIYFTTEFIFSQHRSSQPLKDDRLGDG